MLKKISVIIPAYNEEINLGKTLVEINRYFTKSNREYLFEIVVVNDGSTDKTQKIIFESMKNHLPILPVSYKENKGKGYAVRRGLLEANHDLCLVLDADLSVKLHEFGIAVSKFNLKQHQLFIVKGQRNQVVRQPLYRIFVGKCWKVLVYLKTGLYLDSQCPFTLLNLPKSFYKELKIDGFAFDVEILNNAKKKNIPIHKMSVDYYNQRDSSVTLKGTIQMFKDLFKIKG